MRHFARLLCTGWVGSRVVSVLDSGAEGPGFKSQPRSLGDSGASCYCGHLHRVLSATDGRLEFNAFASLMSRSRARNAEEAKRREDFEMRHAFRSRFTGRSVTVDCMCLQCFDTEAAVSEYAQMQ